MKILNRYIFGAVLRATLVSLLVLLALQSLFVFLGEFDRIGESDYNVAAVGVFVAGTTPERIVELLPLAFLLGGLLGMGGLAHGSELVVMRASGRSILGLVMAAMVPGVLLVGLGFWMGETLAPDLSQQATLQRAVDRGASLSILQGRGFWARNGDEFVHVKRISPTGNLVGIDLYRWDAGTTRLSSISRARSGVYRDGVWLLRGLTVTELAENGANMHASPQRVWKSTISPRLLGLLSVEPEMLPMRELGLYANYLETNGLEAVAHRLAWWTKFMAPVSNLVMLFVAMPLVFGPLRTRGLGQRLFAGILLGVVYFLVNRTISSLGLAYGLPPALSAALPPLLFFTGGLIAMARVR